jgi:nucleoside-diphosphate kinase
MKRTPVVVMAIRWINAVSGMRNFIWATNPVEAQLWTIRWDFALTLDGNIIHASDSVENAEIELNRFFKWEWIYDYRRLVDEII